MTTESDAEYTPDALEALGPGIDGMTDEADETAETDDSATPTMTTPTTSESTRTATDAETDDSESTESTDARSGATDSSDTPRSEWTTASGDTLPQREDHHSHPQSRNWSFGVIRVIRVVVGMVAFFVLLFNIDGAFHRVLSNPGLAALTLAVISQFVQVEDLQNVRSLLGR